MLVTARGCTRNVVDQAQRRDWKLRAPAIIEPDTSPHFNLIRHDWS